MPAQISMDWPLLAGLIFGLAAIPWLVRAMLGRWLAFAVAALEIPAVLIGGPVAWTMWADECHLPYIRFPGEPEIDLSKCQPTFFTLPFMLLLVILTTLLLAFTLGEVSRRRPSTPQPES